MRLGLSPETYLGQSSHKGLLWSCRDLGQSHGLGLAEGQGSLVGDPRRPDDVAHLGSVGSSSRDVAVCRQKQSIKGLLLAQLLL